MKYTLLKEEKIIKHNFSGKLLDFVRQNKKGLEDGKYEVQQVKTENNEINVKYRRIR